MKKIVCAVCAVIMLLSCALFGGCAGVPAPGPAPTEAPVKPVTAVAALALAARAEQPKDPAGLFSSEIEMFEEGSNYNELQKQWMAYYEERIAAAEDAPDITAFTEKLYNELMKSGGGKNLVWSPVNVYIALSLLAETTAGDTRAEILDLLGAADIVSLRKGVTAILKAETSDDGVSTCLIANSVWLNGSLEYNTEALKNLAEIYEVSSFSGDPYDPAFKQAIADWINDNTNGLLKEQAGNVEPGDLMTLVSTLYYKAPWADEFNKGETSDDVFHAPSGDITCAFMHSSELNGTLYISEKFTAWGKPMKNRGTMWFFLPNEGYGPADIADDVMAFIVSPNKDGANYLLHVSIPKLDVSSEIDLIPAIRSAGVTKIFGGGDFTPLSNGDVYVSAIKHAARLTADEVGVEAAAFTTISYCGSAFFENDEAWFTLDEPFMFVLTGMSGQALFTGQVYLPME